jgi:hypothetical protein
MTEQTDWNAMAEQWAKRCGWYLDEAHYSGTPHWAKKGQDGKTYWAEVLPDFANSVDVLLASMPEGYGYEIADDYDSIVRASEKYRAEIFAPDYRYRERRADTAAHALLLALLAVPVEETGE